MRSKLHRPTIFDFVNMTLISIVTIMCILPFVHILALSLSSNAAVNANKVFLIPLDFNFKAYTEVFHDEDLFRSFWITVKRIGLGLSINMILIVISAYPLSFRKERFPLRGVYAFYILITMIFSGGLIPTYILINKIGLMDTVWALIVPGVPAFSVILMMNFFRQLPHELEESAVIEGASHFVILSKIYIPLSAAAIVTLFIFGFVGHWNSWFDGLIYMNDVKNYPLQTFIQIMLSRSKSITSIEDAKRFAEISHRSFQSAYIFVSIIPIIILFPSMQRYYSKGIVLGAVKG